MKTEIKKETNFKLDIIKKIINELCIYNGIVGYDNRKDFKIKFDFGRRLNSKDSFYTIKILRGLNNPKEVFKTTYECENDKEIKKLIEEIINSNNFLYTSFKCKNNIGMISQYNINLKNNTVIEMDIKDANMMNYIKNLENDSKQIVIKENYEQINKDDIQKEKIVKIFNLFTNIFNELSSYNLKDISKNIIAFKISSIYDTTNECFKYEFSINDLYNKNTILNLTASIRDNKFIYDYIYKLIKNYKSKDYFFYDMIKKDIKDSYVINLSNNCMLEFEISNNYDKYFYNGIFNNENNKTLQKEL